jgi:hypothetical protein
MSDEEISFENDHISVEDLVENLQQLIEKVKSGNLQSSTRQDIYDSIEEYLTGKTKELDPKTLSYLFRGWFVSSALDNLEPQKLSDICPLCMRSGDGSCIGSERGEENKEENP